MDWTIDVIFTVILTTLTGTAVFLVWYAIGRLLEFLGFVNIVYELLKAVLVFWYIPVAFLVLKLDDTVSDIWGGFLFDYSTPVISVVSVVVCLLWMAGVVYFIAKYIFDNVRMTHRYQNAMPIPENGWVCYDRVCEELGVPKERVDAVESRHEEGAKIVGIRKPTIIFPIAEFSDEEYRITFIHELTHYKQKVLWVKHLTAIAVALHFFNPAMHLLDRKVQEWGETACDYDSIRHVGDVGRYFEVLYKIAVDEKNTSSLQANLVERKGELETRLLRMKRSYKLMNTKKKWTAALTVAAMLVASTVSVSAATVGVGNAYMSLYNASVVEAEHENDAVVNNQELVLYHADGLDEGFTETVGEVEVGKQGARWIDTIIWDISKKASKRTEKFTANKGDHISVMVVSSPSDATVHAGIINPDQTRDYVSGEGNLYYSFECKSTGEYCVYVQNMSSVKVEITGSYIVQ